jgi:Skp family chaperone for outer membrane proteins
MMFNPKSDIKGDFSIDARGSSALLVRDIQNQAYTNLLAAAANPLYQPFIDAQKLFEKALQAQHIDPEDIMRPQEEIDQILEAMKSGKQADPRIEAAKITAESRMEVGKMQMEADKARTEREREALQLQRDIAVLKYASEQKLNLNAVKAQLAGIAIRERGQNAREAMKAQSAAAEMHLKVNPANPSHEGI